MTATSDIETASAGINLLTDEALAKLMNSFQRYDAAALARDLELSERRRKRDEEKQQISTSASENTSRKKVKKVAKPATIMAPASVELQMTLF